MVTTAFNMSDIWSVFGFKKCLERSETGTNVKIRKQGELLRKSWDAHVDSKTS